jgi:hypothetical protein
VRQTIGRERRSVLHFLRETLFPSEKNPTNPTASDARPEEAGLSGDRETALPPDQAGETVDILRQNISGDGDHVVGMVGLVGVSSVETISGSDLQSPAEDEGTI